MEPNRRVFNPGWAWTRRWARQRRTWVRVTHPFHPLFGQELRNSSDWHRRLDLCALTETLILDEDGLYDPTQFNDRLLLGLKGAMSEAELHLLRARLRGGLLNKARLGELRGPLPVGLVYDPEGRIVLDPNQHVQASVRLLFQSFSARAPPPTPP